MRAGLVIGHYMGYIDQMPGGRPTTYDPELGERIVALMTEGLSLAAAAAECDIHRQRIYDWKDTHPEFDELVKLAMGKRQVFLERRLLKADVGAVVTSTIFALKNAAAADWRDKQEIDHTSSDGSMTPKEPSYRLVGTDD